jgi:hypothetical protein
MDDDDDCQIVSDVHRTSGRSGTNRGRELSNLISDRVQTATEEANAMIAFNQMPGSGIVQDRSRRAIHAQRAPGDHRRR